jgi:hypothetical protein
MVHIAVVLRLQSLFLITDCTAVAAGPRGVSLLGLGDRLCRRETSGCGNLITFGLDLAVVNLSRSVCAMYMLYTGSWDDNA